MWTENWDSSTPLFSTEYTAGVKWLPRLFLKLTPEARCLGTLRSRKALYWPFYALSGTVWKSEKKIRNNFFGRCEQKIGDSTTPFFFIEFAARGKYLTRFSVKLTPEAGCLGTSRYRKPLRRAFNVQFGTA